MTGLWRRWARWAARDEDTRPLALTRMLVALCILGDQLRLWQVGLVEHVYRPYAEGGLSGFRGADFVMGFLGPDAGLVLWGILLVSAALFGAGVATRPAMFAAVVAWSQLGHLYPTGDRAIDRVLRTVLLVLIFSKSHARWSLQARLRGRAPARTGPAWPADGIRWLLVLVYLAAGLAKVGNGRWFPWVDPPVLYRIMTDPTSAELDHLFWADLPLPFVLGAAATLVLECSAPLLLTRLAPWWALFGVLLHLGIAATMGLGMFPWGMLALYPLLVSPWLAHALDRLPAPFRDRPDPSPRPAPPPAP